MIPKLAGLIFPLLMIYAAISDLLTYKIANWLCLALLGSFFICAFLAGFTFNEVGVALSCGLVVLTLTFTLFSFGWIGGGDAKFAAASIIWLGWSMSLEYIFLVSILGGALTLLLLSMRILPLPASWHGISWISRLHARSSGIPYGIALALAGLIL